MCGFHEADSSSPVPESFFLKLAIARGLPEGHPSKIKET
jgi:hypothetical protein